MKIIRQGQTPLDLVKSAAAILAPLFAAAIAAAMSIHIVYSGNIRDSLDAKAENLLIDWSLRLRPSVPKVASDITVVSLDDKDLETLPSSPTLLRDATIDGYANVLQAIAASHPRFVVFSWLTSAHPADAIKTEPLAAILDSNDLRARFVLSLPIINDSDIPDTLGKTLPLVDGDDCIYDVNRICSYPPGWDDWIIKKLVKVFWTEIPERHISSNLPYLNSYILNFPKPEGLRHLSFRQVLSGQPLAPNQAYFVGNNVTQDLRFRNAKYVLQRTFTFEQESRHDLQQDGIPFHEFWARLAQMFEAKTTVAIVPAVVERSIVILSLAVLGLIMLRLGVVWAFAALLSVTLLLPVANAFALSYASLYLPSFSLIFGGAIFCVVGMMILVSFSNYQRFRAALVAKHYRDVADIKSNFVSLVSHNLNTSVARLAGLIDIFKGSGVFESQTAVISACNRSIGELFICVRNVLTNLAMNDRKRGVSVLPLRRVIEEFGATHTGMMRRLAIDYELELADPDQGGAIFTGNVKIFHQCLANLLAVSKEFAVEGCLISLAIDVASKRVHISTKYFMPPDPQATVLAYASADGAAALNGFGRLALDYIGGVVAWADGSMTARQSGANVEIEIALDLASVKD